MAWFSTNSIAFASTTTDAEDSVLCKCGSVSWTTKMDLKETNYKLVTTVPAANTFVPKIENTEVVCAAGSTISCTARVMNQGATAKASTVTCFACDSSTTADLEKTCTKSDSAATHVLKYNANAKFTFE